ncbi:MAG TPA: helix-turn-helix transcriptional regulator [Solirubrobacterales bacterium]|jgi:transcriptional regulator with XRE-family HTH domain|nr:helix-turn-helix transcriptional regulator [Solirubrobacterales bacterium]
MEGFDKRVAEQLGRRVKRRRNFLDLSQEAVAERAGIHHTQISLYEHGQRMPLTSTLIKLAAALGVSVDQLVTGIEWGVVDPRSSAPADAGGDEGADDAAEEE